MQLLKADARNWTSKYARGGNVRKPSARKMYIVVDALQGHITTNGYVDVVAHTVLLRHMRDGSMCCFVQRSGRQYPPRVLSSVSDVFACMDLAM